MNRTAVKGAIVLQVAMVMAAQPLMAAATRADATEKAADDRGKIVCKRFTQTGSLVRNYRTCKTKWEWERERENLRTVSVSDSCRDRANGGYLCN